MNKIFKIDDFVIGADKTFIIAELSANHNGSLDIAKQTVRAASRAGADAIKLQTYTPDTITLNSKNEDFRIHGTIWEGRYLYDLYEEAHTPWEWHVPIMEVAKEEGLVCFSSPFDNTAVDFLEGLDVPAYKIASFEITDIPLIEYTASKGKPIILSTGIASIDDIELALEACRRMGNENVALLKCTSSYPAPLEEANLQMVSDFRSRFNVLPGLSDHTIGNLAPLAAVTLGAKIIEKHFILDDSIGGPDASFSMTEKEFLSMTTDIRNLEAALGGVNYDLSEKQKVSRAHCRSLYITENIKKGECFTSENVKSIRPGFGLHPKYLNQIIGRKANTDIIRGSRMSFDLIEK